VAGLGFLRRPDETLGLHLNWSPGEVGAREALIRFMEESLGDYGRGRDLPGIRGTSRLSPRLHFGEIGPRRVWYEITRTGGADGESYLRQLAWREFSYHLLHHYPDAATTPMRKSFERFPWIDAPGALRAWQEGRTGYPIVDAGMRELLATGWMHNRVRMVAASFLVKHLMIHWTEGVKWFWERLVDADLANNTMGWQWVAGSGADAAPYFRVFNPVTQGRKFDPDGNYVRTWVPELASLPNEYVHTPWTAPTPLLENASVRLGRDYPEPIVNHEYARARALQAYDSIKKSGLRLASTLEEAA
jgi:deoxyribodipyrimidine photo-lyase